MFVKFC